MGRHANLLVLSLCLALGCAHAYAQGMPNPQAPPVIAPQDPDSEPPGRQQDIHSILETFKHLIKPIRQADVEHFAAISEQANAWLESHELAQRELTKISIPAHVQNKRRGNFRGLIPQEARRASPPLPAPSDQPAPYNTDRPPPKGP